MNELGQNVLTALEKSTLGKMSIHVLKKQSVDAGIDLNDITRGDIPRLVERLKAVLPFFIGEESGNVLINIKKLGNNGGIPLRSGV